MWSSFNVTSAPVRRDSTLLGTIGVRRTRPAMRADACSMSASVIMAGGLASAETNIQDFVGPVAARGGHRDGVADLLADQGLGERGGNRQARRLDVGLMHADDLVGGFLVGLFIDQLHMRPELHVAAGQRGRIDD